MHTLAPLRSRSPTARATYSNARAYYAGTMALAYAFIDATGSRHGANDTSEHGIRDFPYTPASGPFAGQQLTMLATTWDGNPSGTWLTASERWGCYATDEVEELLDIDRPKPDSTKRRPSNSLPH